MTGHAQPRATWGARLPIKRVHHIDEQAERTAFVVHWLGPAPRDQDPVARLRGAQRFHQGSRGWADIGYNLAVANQERPEGQLADAWVARGWDAVGAHAPGFNRSGYGCIVLLGQGETPTPAALLAVAELYHEACDRAGRKLLLLDHQGTGRSTSCAGPQLRAQVAHWRAVGVPGPMARPSTSAPPQPPPQQPAAPAAPGYPGHVLRRGSRGGSVTRWQQRMADRGWRIAVDGQFGPGSETVARAFQTEKGLAVDGMVGPATWRATWASPVT